MSTGDDAPSGGPASAWELLGFLAAVALPMLSAGILVIEVMRLADLPLLMMDTVLSGVGRRILGLTLAAVGFAACIGFAFDRSSPEHVRRLHRAFLFVNLALTTLWLIFWAWTLR